MHEGIQGLTRDKTRPSRIPPLPAETVDRVVVLTNQAPPHEATHWSAPAMAKTFGISPSSVRRIWMGQGLQPHRVRSFKISNDPRFADKLKDVVGLYVDPPAHAVVFSIDEKSQIQALDRTQPGLPMKKGRCATMTPAVSLQPAGLTRGGDAAWSRPAAGNGSPGATEIPRAAGAPRRSACTASRRARTRSRIASCPASGTHTAVSSPARCSRARLAASRRSVLTRSPARFGISEGATTMRSCPCADK